MSKETDQAVTVYRDEYNCAQAIFSVYGDRFGLDGELAKKIACGFGGGAGRSGGMCGAVAGAILVLGLKYGMADSSRQEEKHTPWSSVKRFSPGTISLEMAVALWCGAVIFQLGIWTSI